MTDEELTKAFEDCTLPKPLWTHEAHIRVAWFYSSCHTLADATAAMKASIIRYAAHNRTPNEIDRGYHETTTLAFVRLVYAANLIGGEYSSANDLINANPGLVDKSTFWNCYSHEHLMTMQAKAEFTEPDLCGLPVVFGKGGTVSVSTADEETLIFRQLFQEYADGMELDLSFQDFDEELAGLPGQYALPSGRLILARHYAEPAGCIAIRPFEVGVCELKRLWVRPTHRGLGYGRQLIAVAMAEANRIGYKLARLDTLSSMQAAIKLYKDAGFYEIPAYRSNPLSNAVYMEAAV